MGLLKKFLRCDFVMMQSPRGKTEVSIRLGKFPLRDEECCWTGGEDAGAESSGQGNTRLSSRSLNTSTDLRQPNVSRGLPFNSAAALSRSSRECTDRSVPFGKYCRRRPLVFVRHERRRAGRAAKSLSAGRGPFPAAVTGMASWLGCTVDRVGQVLVDGLIVTFRRWRQWRRGQGVAGHGGNGM